MDGDNFVFCFIMSYVCVFYYGWRKERGFLRWGGGHGFWIGFPFFDTLYFFYTYLHTSMDFSLRLLSMLWQRG